MIIRSKKLIILLTRMFNGSANQSSSIWSVPNWEEKKKKQSFLISYGNDDQVLASNMNSCIEQWYCEELRKKKQFPNLRKKIRSWAQHYQDVKINQLIHNLEIHVKSLGLLSEKNFAKGKEEVGWKRRWKYADCFKFDSRDYDLSWNPLTLHFWKKMSTRNGVDTGQKWFYHQRGKMYIKCSRKMPYHLNKMTKCKCNTDQMQVLSTE